MVSIIDTDIAKNIVGIIKEFYEPRLPKLRDGLSLHQRYFDDVTPDADFGLVLATQKDVKAILNFTEGLVDNDRLLVHCSAGISRSTAVACGILYQHGLSPLKAIEKISSIRKGARPNTYIISLMDDALGLKGELQNTLQKYGFD